MDIITYAKSKTYTNETAEEFGGLKGANCTIKSITSISGGNRVTFEWKNTEGATQEGTLDVMDGVNGNDGLGIKSVTINASNHLIITYDDDTTEDAGEVQTVQGEDGKSAYEIAVEEGYSGTKEEWLASLKGEDGEEGFSPEITVKESTSERYVLTIKTKDDEFDTPNLKGGGSGSASRMSDLEDVQLTSLTTGQILKWDGSKWVNEDGVEIDSLGDINDVALGTLTDGQMLSWDATNHKWVNKDADSALDSTSKNPVANDALCEEFGKKQDKDLETPIEVDGTEQTTVENALSALNTYAAKKVDQLNSLPVASADTLRMLVQYKGATTSTLKHAFFYECKVVEGSDPTEYEWVDAGIGGEDLSQYKKIFSGTSEEWDALPLEDKITYDYIMSDDDGETGDIADVVESGNHNPVESDAVFNSERNIYEVMGKNGAKNILPFVYNQNVTNTQNCTASESNGVVTYTPSGIYSRMAYAYNGALEIGVSYRVRFKAKFTKTGDPLSYALRSNYDWEDSGNYVFQIISSSTSDYVTIDEVFTATSEDLYLLFYVARGNSYSGNKLEIKELQINLASDTDSTYQPYAKTNQQLTQENQTLTNNITNIKAEIADMNNILGAKNLLPFPYYDSSKTSNGITWTVNNDGSISASGTATESSYFRLTKDDDLSKYNNTILNGCPASGGMWTNYALYLSGSKDGQAVTKSDEGEGVLIQDIPSGYTGGIYAKVISGQTVNITFYPMIRPASIADDTYEPYSMTNQQITPYVQAISNPNLLDNPWFTVNQRGQNSYSNGYAVDRWKANSGMTCDVTTNGVTLTHPDNTDNADFLQYYESDRLKDAVGKKVTVSVMLANGTIYSGTAEVPTIESARKTIITLDIGSTTFKCDLIIRTTNPFCSFYSSTANATINIKAVKLELGSVSTLAQDTAPNYATELLKCQRYFYRIDIPQYQQAGVGVAQATSSLTVTFYTPVNMRIKPSVTSNGAIKLRSGSNYIAVESIITYGNGNFNRFDLQFTTAQDALTAGEPYALYASSGASYLDFSADL